MGGFPLDEVIKLGIALLLGAIVGFERERTHKPAGLRTHMLVCLGATLATIISISYFPQDNARIVASLMTGIGFLCAGTIIAQGKDVHGLTTAASVWVVATIGIAVGVGYYTLASISALVVLLVLLFGKFEKKLTR
ncbi:MAG TPA: MgtC/SapB family protein [Candidatus Nanoarchaeia archaeon]|nr:MgtC/SapB family protein [Candidatus Nanoarchaeia archaeon]